MTRAELLPTLIAVANRNPGEPARPVALTLRDGSTFTATITSFRLQMPDGVVLQTLQTLDAATSIERQVLGEEIVGMELVAVEEG